MNEIKQEIIDMVSKIQSERLLKYIRDFVKKAVTCWK